MKKILIFALACVMLMLCACGNQQPAETTPSTTAPQASTPETTAPETTAPATTAPADLKSLAISCIDLSVDELYALVGEPNETDYVPSCLMVGEDGMLIYDDFIVYTYRLDGEETVVDVE